MTTGSITYDVRGFYVIPCRNCGTPFRVRPEHKRRRYCSIACWNIKHPCKARTDLWTPAEIKQLRALAGTVSSREIARLLNRPYQGTLKKAYALGIPMRRVGEYHPYVKYTDQQVEQARALADEGMMARKIAAQMGIAVSTIQDWIQYRRRLGYTPKVW